MKEAAFKVIKDYGGFPVDTILKRINIDSDAYYYNNHDIDIHDSISLVTIYKNPDHFEQILIDVPDTEELTNTEIGIKHDDDKLRWDLVPYDVLEEVIKVITWGANEYGEHNWKLVDNGLNRYFAACMRHLVAYKKGEFIDSGTNTPHLANAICNLIFLLYLEKEEMNNDY